jgi:small nuclear ribonucleoprotein (snRNP)-like protein
LSSIIFRRFGEEITAFVGKPVIVETVDDKHYTGMLLGLDENLNLILDKVTGAGENVFKVAVNGKNVKEIKLTGKPFDYKALGERMNRVFPGLVSVRENIGAVIVMDKIKVTEKGIVEGTGLAADKARAIYDEYMRETKK